MIAKSLHRLMAFLIGFNLMVVLISGCTTKTKQVLMILPEQSGDMEFMLTNEVGVMKDMLTKAGFTVLVATDSGKPLAGEKTTLTPDMKIADVKIEKFDGLLIPCLARDFEYFASSQEIEVIKKAVEKGKVIADQTGGVLDLLRAGVLSGKQYAFVEDLQADFPDAIYKGSGVVEDGKILTGAICPYMERIDNKKGTTVDLTKHFIDKLNLN